VSYAGIRSMNVVSQELRQALRGFTRRPGFTAVAVLTIAIGIGANTAIFSVADALLLRPLPYAQPERLVLLAAQKNGVQFNRFTVGVFSWPHFQQIERESRSFSGVAGVTEEVFNVTGAQNPEQVQAARVTSNFLPVIGVRPALGRGFTPREDRPGGPLVVLLSDAMWRRRFHADPAVLGREITLDQNSYTIIGVLPPDFRFDLVGPKIDLVAPRVFDLNLATPQQIQGGAGFLYVVARLSAGVSLEQARTEMQALTIRYGEERPGFPDTDATVRADRLRDDVAANYRPAVLILFGSVALVLLIACGNVASLLLAHGLGRRRETALRSALGAGRGRLIRQLLTESVILALAGGAVGVLMSAWGTHLIVALAGDALPRGPGIGIDARVLLFTLGISIIAGLLFGLAPAVQFSRGDLNAMLRAEGRGSTPGRERNALLRLLVVAQVALSTILLVGASLLLRNFVQLRDAAPGFDPHGLLTMNIELPPARYGTKAQMVAFFDELLRQVRSVRGVESAAVASALPAYPTRFSPALPEGQPAVPLAQRPLFAIQTFTPGYAGTLRVPLLRGRDFSEHDGANDRRVALVNETLARRYWPVDNPIGKHILLGRQKDPVEVVGVLGDLRNTGLASDVQPEIYLPFAQLPWASMNLIVRSAGDPRNLTAGARDAVFATDRDQPVTLVRTMDEVLDAAAAQPRFTTSLIATLSGAALLLAAIGIYGVIAYSVAERTSEMGVRIALGAERAHILRLVLRQGLGMALVGIAIGLAAAAAAAHLLASQLYHVSPTEPWAFAASAVVFASVAALASYIPARRAVRVDPLVALRQE
jgi:putative ABC transport system permease protein